MDNELNQPAPPEAQPQAPSPEASSAGPAQGQNFSQGQGQGKGRRRRRRRGKKAGGGGMQPGQAQPGNGQPPQHMRSQHQHRQGGQQQGGGGGRRRQRPGGGRRGRGGTPFVGPMDHSYRNGQDNIGNLADAQDRFRGRGNPNGNFSSTAQYKPDMSPVAMNENAPARIFCFIEDLFFLAKINEVSKKLGVKVEFVKTADPILERAGDDIPENERPALIIIDLNNNNIKPLTLIPKLRSKLKKSTSIIGFLSHIQGELKVKAQEAGCDTVMPRSAFSQNLPNLLRRHAEEEDPFDTRQPV
jgi:CheY-like chemotaxis protein